MPPSKEITAVVCGALLLVLNISDLIGEDRTRRLENFLLRVSENWQAYLQKGIESKEKVAGVCGASAIPLFVLGLVFYLCNLVAHAVVLEYAAGLFGFLGSVLLFLSFVLYYFLPLILSALIYGIRPFVNFLHGISRLSGQSSYFKVGKYLVNLTALVLLLWTIAAGRN